MVVSASHFQEVTNGYEKRSDGLWVHTGRLIVRQGPVDLPVGSIDTVEIAANAVQQVLGSFASGATWSTTAVSAWVGTTVAVSATCGGGLVRVEFTAVFVHTAANSPFAYGLGLDSTTTPFIYWWSQSAANSNGLHTVAGIAYTTPTATAHTFTLLAFNTIAGTLSLYGSGYQSLYVTEQKR